jgi:hypothetical protein
MININFDIYNPWSNTWTILWNKSAMFGQNKACEFNGYRTNHFVNLNFEFRPCGDHGGVRLMLGLFGFDIELHFYDTRHWDYELNAYIKDYS